MSSHDQLTLTLKPLGARQRGLHLRPVDDEAVLRERVRLDRTAQAGVEVGHRRRQARARRVGDEERQEHLRRLRRERDVHAAAREGCRRGACHTGLEHGYPEPHAPSHAATGTSKLIEWARMSRSRPGAAWAGVSQGDPQSRTEPVATSAVNPASRPPTRFGPRPKSKPSLMPLSTKTRTAVRRRATSETELSGLWMDCTTSIRVIESFGRAHAELGVARCDPATVRRGQPVLAGNRGQSGVGGSVIEPDERNRARKREGWACLAGARDLDGGGVRDMPRQRRLTTRLHHRRRELERLTIGCPPAPIRFWPFGRHGGQKTAGVCTRS